MKRNKGSGKRNAGAPAKAAPKKRNPQDHVIERPDGFYWQSSDGVERGPFQTLAEAEADMLTGGEEGYEPSETLQEAESEVGIAEWIDPDTGVPAEDSVPRIEDH